MLIMLMEIKRTMDIGIKGYDDEVGNDDDNDDEDDMKIIVMMLRP